MIGKSTLIAAAMALALGIAQTASPALAHGHGGGHNNGHNNGENNGQNNHNHDHNNNNNNNYHYNSDEFWSGPTVNEVVVFGNSSAVTDPCTDLNYRLDYPGLCVDGD